MTNQLQSSLFANMADLVAHFRNSKKKYTLLFAFNSVGKTRLSMAFKDAGKNEDDADTLYFNAFTEDLFSWDNDLDNDTERLLLINKYSRFVTALRDLEMENKVRPLLLQYADFNFLIDYEYKDKDKKEYWGVNFIREVIIDGQPQNVENIKVSRGEENIFKWCFFLAVAQLAIDKQEGYDWVKNIYIDDPVSSLDDNNAIAIAHHLVRMLKTEGNELKIIISTHHGLFFNVLCNSFGKNAPRLLLSKKSDGYVVKDTTDSPFLYHVSLLQELQKAIDSDRLYTNHFNKLRVLLENSANFHGFNGFSDCLIINDDDENGTLHTRMVNILNHGGYSLFQPTEMGEENKKYFKQIFENFMKNYKFNVQLFEKATSPVEKAPEVVKQTAILVEEVAKPAEELNKPIKEATNSDKL